MKLSDWTVSVEPGNCVHVSINESVPLNNVTLSLVNDSRHAIMSMKVTSHDVYVCTPLERPMFIKIDDMNKYIDGSGLDTYKEQLNDMYLFKGKKPYKSTIVWQDSN